jgi:hypothetical protein
VKEQIDFLVPFACTPTNGKKKMFVAKYITSRFHADAWIKEYTETPHRWNTYEECLALAFLLTPNLILPETIWDTDTFIDAFDTVVRETLTLHLPPKRHNLPAARKHPKAGPIIARYEDSFGPDACRFFRLYEAMVESIHNYGIPPPEVVQRLDNSIDCRRLIEKAQAINSDDLDVDRAVQSGKKRKWDTMACRRACAVLSLYIDGIEHNLCRMSIGETYDRYRQKQTMDTNTANACRIEQAKSLNVWRIRRTEIEQWRQNLSKDEWSLYMKCERYLRTSLSEGVYSQIPRRRFNNASLDHMRLYNLPLLQSLAS